MDGVRPGTDSLHRFLCKLIPECESCQSIHMYLLNILHMLLCKLVPCDKIMLTRFERITKSEILMGKPLVAVLTV